MSLGVWDPSLLLCGCWTCKAGERLWEGEIVVSRAGLEPVRLIENAQLIDFTKRQKRQNRFFRRFEVHGGYTDSEFFSSRTDVATNCLALVQRQNAGIPTDAAIRLGRS